MFRHITLFSCPLSWLGGVILLLIGCRATQPVKVAEKAVHDTLWLQSLHYDSIYVGNDRSLERIADTVFLRERSVEYRYRLLHDSIYICRRDSIPYPVEVVRTVQRQHNWLDRLSYVISNFAPPNFRKVKAPIIGKVKAPI